MIRSLKIRLYPTQEQELLMYKHIGCSRFIWNYMLALQQERYERGKKHLSKFDMNKLLTPLKKQSEYEWLNEVSNSTLQVVCGDLSEAYTRFFKKLSGLPKFKSKKRSRLSFPLRSDCLYFNGDAVIAKLGKVKCRSSKPIPQGKGQKFTNPRISLVNGKWILSFGIECENQAFDLEGTVGIDLGIKEFATVSHNGEPTIFHNINKSRRVRTLKSKLRHLQRKVSRMYETNNKTNRYERKWHKSNGIIAVEKQIAEIQYHLSTIQRNHTHQTTHAIVSMNPQRIVMEDLNVGGMMKNRHLSRAIAECTFYEFRRQMEYKCEERGIELVIADRFYPSSKTCSCCGTIKKDLKLSDRVFECECGFRIDRDFNAALNLERYAS